MGTSEAQGKAEALGASDDDVRAEFRGWPQDRQRERIGRDDEQGVGRVSARGERGVIENRAIGRGVLDQRTERRLREVPGFVAGHDDLDTERLGARLEHRDRLGMAALGDEETLAVARLVEHAGAQRHRFGRGGRLVEQRRIRDR